jgi:urease accessory protein
MSAALLSLLQLSDPTLPIGGFAHSAGLETYVQQRLVTNVETAQKFITEMLTQNLQYTDAALVSLVFDAARQEDIKKIVALDMECSAVKLPLEMRQASQKLGVRLIKIFHSVCKNEMADQYRVAIQLQKAAGHYCIAFGIYAAALGVEKEDALIAFYYNAAVGFVTNCVKLIPLGQQDGQELLFSLQPLIYRMVKCSMKPDVDLIGLCCAGFDISSMQHEHLYSRLYMS